jgi:DNA polymerase-4
MQKIYWDPVRVANELREYIKQKCWFTVNVWIGNNKFLAKMASDFEKPDKVHTLYIDEIEEKMWPLPIWNLFWCWRKTEPVLKKMWINTIWDLAKKDKALIKANIWSYWSILHDNANWIDNTKVENTYDDRKGIWASSITKIDTKDRDYILSFFQWFAAELAIWLKNRDLAWDRLTVHIRYTDFSIKSHQMKLHNPINTIEELYTYATKLFDELRDLKDVNLVWMSISGLQNIRFKQETLF